MRTEVTFDRISDRQDLIPLMETRRLGLEPYMMDRDDMYWAHVSITDDGLKAQLSYCMDVSTINLADGCIFWTLSKQYGPDLLDTQAVRDRVSSKWVNSEEGKQARQWVQNLIDAGYYDHGRSGSPNGNYGRCPHCNRQFEKGTSHPHTYLVDWNHKGEKEIIYHHRLMEKEIKEKGLTKQGVSALPDIPSLEEIGELEPVTIS